MFLYNFNLQYGPSLIQFMSVIILLFLILLANEMLRKCIICGQAKENDFFYSGRPSCKDCFNEQRRKLVECNRCKDEYIPGKRGRGKFCGDKCRFMDKVKKQENGCWLWTGHTQKDRGYGVGYGIFVFRENTSFLAHRASYIIFKKEIPDNLLILHSCDVFNCVNPLHLRAGTSQQNAEDMLNRERHKVFKGEDNASSKLTEAIVKKIRDLKDLSSTELSKRFNISKSQIKRIKNGLSWTHI